MSLFQKKSLTKILADAEGAGKGLKRTLGAGNLIALGVGAIIGAGLFVRTADAAASAAGPAVTISFIIAAIGCAFAGLCYAEFASMIPIAGSAYTYSYVTMGELIAWIIGWALIMEYALGAATVAIAWSEYLNSLLGMRIPYEWTHSPFQSQYIVSGNVEQFAPYIDGIAGFARNGMVEISKLQFQSLPAELAATVQVTSGIFNAPAVIILFLLTLLLIRGTQQSALINMIIVIIKVAIIILFIVIGWQFINPDNYDPYVIPKGPGHEDFFKHGWGGILGGAAIVFFAFIGFDAVSTAAQEAKNPKKDMPIGILGSLVVCTILYVLFGHVLTGVAPFEIFKTAGKEASVTFTVKEYMEGYQWLATGIEVAILAGFSSVILVMLMGQSRIFYTISNDGLLPASLGKLHPKYQTPYKANWILFIFVALFAALVPGDVTGDLTSFGTLFAFVLVSIGVWMLRVKDPHTKRPFKTPLVPLVPILGAVLCAGMIVALDKQTLQVAGVWMALGLVVYFLYSRKRSKLNKDN